jgi:hypothetical protein
MRVLTKPKPTPLSIFKLSVSTPEYYALFIHLDNYPYCEVKAWRLDEFVHKLAVWKRDNLASLRSPVSVRFFARSKENPSIQEVRF